MDSFVKKKNFISTLQRLYKGDEMKNNGIGGACGTYR
jgi:hypothetical protein